MTFSTLNPATGESLQTYQHLSMTEVERSISQAFLFYQKPLPLTERKDILLKIAALFRSEKNNLARLMALEMGKPLVDGLAEVEKCAVTCENFVQNAEGFLRDEKVDANYSENFIVKEAMGPVLTIMPWNFPLWQVIRFAAPAVLIGNPILLKHSNLTAGFAIKIEEIFLKGFGGRKYLFNLRIDHDQAAKVMEDPRVRGVTFTGSTRGGREIAAIAGRNLKKCVLELGGSDAYLVLEKANPEKSAKICGQARMTNNGQSCVSAKRFIVHESNLETFLSVFEQTLRSYRRGNPLEEGITQGPLASKKFQEELKKQTEVLEKSGAEKVCDLGEVDDFKKPSAYFGPRIYLHKKPSAFFFEEELFGPVAQVLSFRTNDQAVEFANQSVFGLGSAVFSEDVVEAWDIARRLEAGFVAINDQVKSDARLPFGGVKDSGFGRELSRYGFDEFVNVKSIGVRS